ncbi:MAG: hypothetical protein DRG87_09575 [Deltaproteobacteria bacterium]|nr:MAG: hypothetical protein DRG87_09575 [Deltaproteobacteria bacterium]
MYSKTVMDHFRNSRNSGTIEDADGVREVGNPLCGDIMTMRRSATAPIAMLRFPRA